jgi:hypothetical protein
MYRSILIWVIVLIIPSSGLAQIVTTNFLQCPEPAVMCQNYIDNTYGKGTMTFINPRGGATLRIHGGQAGDYCVTIFCDISFHGLVMFHYLDKKGVRVPIKITSYGVAHSQSLEADLFLIPYTESNTPARYFEKYLPRFDSIGEFDQPVDVVIGTSNGYHDPDSDFVYIVDQGNHRIVKLRYDHSIDSLVWVGTFGEDILIYPTAIAYADYGSSNRIDHDVYVTDAANAKFYRFSA